MPFRGTDSPIKALLTCDDDALSNVSEDRIAGALERSPRARAARRLALPPDDLAAHQQSEVLQNLSYIPRKRPVRATAEVRHVDSNSTSRFENALALGEDIGEQLEVLDVRSRHTVLAQLLLIL